jgi:hypothetical protein
MLLTRREFAVLTGITALATIVPHRHAGATTRAAAGWALRFDRVNDLLLVRVGGEQGALISWGDRGLGGQYTWSWQDPVGEVREIGGLAGVGDQPELVLWAKVSEAGATGNLQATFVTLYGAEERQRWDFDTYEEHSVRRSP